MRPPATDGGLAQSLRSWSGLRLQARVEALSADRVAEWARLANRAAVAALPAFGTFDTAETSADLEPHAAALAAALCRVLASATAPDFEFVRLHARRHAAHRLPIEAALQAYRCMLPLLARSIGDAVVPARGRDRAFALATLAEVTTHYGASAIIVFAAEFVSHASVFAEAEGDRRAELLGLLVGGFDESDARVVRLLKRSGYLEQRLRFCVALVQSADPLEMESTARVRRIVDALADCVATSPVRALVGVRGNLVTAVFSDIRRLSGWTASQTSLAERIDERLRGLGPAVRVGVSGDQASPAQIPRGLHEATVALDFASVGERVVGFCSLSIRRLLIHRGVEYVQSALPAWFALLRDADARSRGELMATLRALADADLNVQGAARDLRVHANTVYARLQRIEDLTGLDARRYHDLTQLLLAADCGSL